MAFIKSHFQMLYTFVFFFFGGDENLFNQLLIYIYNQNGTVLLSSSWGNQFA